MDAAGTVDGGTLTDGAYGYGMVFKLTTSKRGYTFTDLHDFTGGSDGAYLVGILVLDASTNTLDCWQRHVFVSKT
jgi:hypothetical protein